ncbi:MAG: hypothetical protein AAF197_10205 [Pseudomonadota bacterium]
MIKVLTFENLSRDEIEAVKKAMPNSEAFREHSQNVKWNIAKAVLNSRSRQLQIKPQQVGELLPDMAELYV